MKHQKFTWLLIFGILALMLLFSSHPAIAQDPDTKNLAKQSQNPVAKLISVPFENTSSFNNGPEDGYVNILNIKPVVPVSLNENWNLINRVILPIIYQEELVRGQDDDFGLGDISYQAFFSPAKPGKVIWGVGPTLVLPTGGNRMTSDKWSMGPSVVVLTMPGQWVIGALAQQVWSLGGLGEAEDVSQFLCQYFINYNMKGGWYLSTTPTITANWEAGGGDTWTVPFGGGFGRVFKIGKQPVNASLKAYYNAHKPDHASNWSLVAGITFLFPK